MRLAEFLHAFEGSGQAVEFVLGDSRRYQPAHDMRQSGTHIVQVEHFLEAQLAHEDAVIAHHDHQPSLFQQPHRLADDASAHAQCAGHRQFVQSVARCEFAAEDLVFDGLADRIDAVVERFGPHHIVFGFGNRGDGNVGAAGH